MTTFIIVAALMVAAALAWVLWPLLRPSSRKSIEQRVANLTIFKDQFADLDADLRRGSISQDQYGEARAELERRMLDEARAETTAPAPASSARVKTALVLAAVDPDRRRRCCTRSSGRPTRSLRSRPRRRTSTS